MIPAKALSQGLRVLGTRSFTTAARLQGMSANVFAMFSALALQHGAVNLGQGFPSFPSPDFLKDAAAEAIRNNNNQYGRPGGHPELVKVLAEMYSPKFNRNLDPMSEIVTYSGGQAGIVAAMLAFVNAGEEVVCIEPYFDAYVNAARLVQAEVKGVPLRPKGPGARESSEHWHIDPLELERAITPKTRLLIINTPHNPMGKVMSRAELEEVAAIARRHPNLIVMSDEVYEFAVYDGLKHERLATLPDMYEKTITLYSAGKTFSATGWRVGYSIAPPALSKPLLAAHAAVNFCAPVPLEVGVAGAFRACLKNNYYETYPSMLQEKRDRLVRDLREAGLQPIVPQGGYFTMADTSSITQVPAEHDDNDPSKVLEQRRDYRVARWLTTDIKLTGIPPSGFFMPPNRQEANHLIRFCHTKDDATLTAAAQKLKNLANHGKAAAA
eukprot:comp23952_c0_seq1/m.42380 comp23952_c0_seq1/g.42380  ORF comp23952_c0_seq1/g.42380 comp23952_c0_seq1/m.42380 type:complete len:440 (-) comp23952_c0_seq1:438-1757(-)